MNLPDVIHLIACPLLVNGIDHAVRFGDQWNTANVVAYYCDGRPDREWCVYVDEDGAANILVRDASAEAIG